VPTRPRAPDAPRLLSLSAGCRPFRTGVASSTTCRQPRHRAFCSSRHLRHASGSSDASDNPVNSSDLSGLAPPVLTGPGGGGSNGSYVPSQQFIDWVQFYEGTCDSDGLWCTVGSHWQIGFGHDWTGSPPIGGCGTINGILQCSKPCLTIDGTTACPPLSSSQQVNLESQDLSGFGNTVNTELPGS
jgi:hypothetical protein